MQVKPPKEEKPPPPPFEPWLDTIKGEFKPIKARCFTRLMLCMRHKNASSFQTPIHIGRAP